MSSNFNVLSRSLKEFLIEAQSSSSMGSERSSDNYKYNNLKLFINKGKVGQPHFGVRIGISEAYFSIETCELLKGSLGNDKRYISQWYSKKNLKQTLENLWNKADNE